MIAILKRKWPVEKSVVYHNAQVIIIDIVPFGLFAIYPRAGVIGSLAPN